MVRRLSRLTSCLVAMVLLFAPAIRADNVTSSGFQVLVDGAAAGIVGARSSVCVAPDGRTLIAWVNRLGTIGPGLPTHEIWYAVLDPKGQVFLAGPAPLPGVTGDPDRVCAAATAQRFMIAWRTSCNPVSCSSGDSEIWFQVLDHDGNIQFPTPSVANASTSHQEDYPSCAGSTDGTFALAWVRYGTGLGSPSEGVFVRRFLDAGLPLDATEVRVDDAAANRGFQSSTSIARWPSGRMVVAWQDGLAGSAPGSALGADGHGTAILARWLDVGLVPLGAFNVIVNGVTAEDQERPFVAANESTTCVIGWTTEDASGLNDVAFRRFTHSGNVIDQQDRIVTTNLGLDQFLDAVSMTPSGEFALAWSEAGAHSSCTSAAANPARIARYTVSAQLMETLDIEPVGILGRSQARPGMALDQWGNVVCAYESCFNQPAGQVGSLDLRFRRFARTMITFSPATVPIGGTVQISLDSPSDANNVYILMASLGEGPIPLGNRLLKLEPDILFNFSLLSNGLGIFSSLVGQLDFAGKTNAPQAVIPNLPILIGVSIHMAFVAGATTIQTISDTYAFGII